VENIKYSIKINVGVLDNFSVAHPGASSFFGTS
jgi:hypothetical protein